MKQFLFFVVLFSTIKLFGHEKEKHHRVAELPKKEIPVTSLINVSYEKLVKPIFEKKCFDCHGGKTKFPWYYKIPGAKQLIDHDIEESKEHMDLTSAFPFKGHHSPQEDLESIAEVIEKGEMPPWRYWILHREAKITAEERAIILQWSRESLGLLD